jgi:cell fate (sporulation/competence/biofilm development) regulator YlbF (YheA/YmcA/DUF963 family)
MKNVENLENSTNNLLEIVQELEFQIQLFGRKTNITNANKIKALLTNFLKISNTFNDTLDDFFKKK